MPSGAERIAALEAKVKTLEAQMADLAELTGCLMRDTIGAEPVVGGGLRWEMIQDPGDPEPCGIWSLEPH